jgi:hypothetical protein
MVGFALPRWGKICSPIPQQCRYGHMACVSQRSASKRDRGPKVLRISEWFSLSVAFPSAMKPQVSQTDMFQCPSSSPQVKTIEQSTTSSWWTCSTPEKQPLLCEPLRFSSCYHSTTTHILTSCLFMRCVPLKLIVLFCLFPYWLSLGNDQWIPVDNIRPHVPSHASFIAEGLPIRLFIMPHCYSQFSHTVLFVTSKGQCLLDMGCNITFFLNR